MDRRQLARTIDHTCLKPEATWRDIRGLCEEAAHYRFASVCVNPSWVPLAHRLLRDTPVAVCTVVGFPIGATTTAVKTVEAAEAVRAGAREIDMVLNIGRVRGGELGPVAHEIRDVRRAIGSDVLLKVILETALLADDQKRGAALIAVENGADFVKTSTGMCAAGGATVADVRLLSQAVAGRAQVKAAGGIRDTEAALAMLDAGAARIGTSAGVAILEGLRTPAATAAVVKAA